MCLNRSETVCVVRYKASKSSLIQELSEEFPVLRDTSDKRRSYCWTDDMGHVYEGSWQHHDNNILFFYKFLVQTVCISISSSLWDSCWWSSSCSSWWTWLLSDSILLLAGSRALFPRFVEHKKKTAATRTSAPTIVPITIPAIAPPDNDEDELELVAPSTTAVWRGTSMFTALLLDRTSVPAAIESATDFATELASAGLLMLFDT